MTIQIKIKKENIEVYILKSIAKYYEKYGERPTVLIITKSLLSWLKIVLLDKKKYSNQWTWGNEINVKLTKFENLEIISTFREEVIEVY